MPPGNLRIPGVPFTADGHASRNGGMSDATRYLCAAVQLDSVLAERVIREIIDEEFKAPPDSPEVDLVRVLRHALAARGRQLFRDAVLCLLLFCLLIAIGLHASLLLTLIFGALVAWMIVAIEQLVTTYGVVARDLGPGQIGQAHAPPTGSWAAHRLDKIARSAGGNVTVYGSYVPFVGSGIPVDAWSFALDTQRAAEGRVAVPFAVEEIHDHVLAELRNVGIAGVAIEERVFVDGRDLRGDRRFLPAELAAPVSHVDPALVRSLTANPEERIRTYICLRVTGWRGQLVLSTFIRFVATKKNLFVEASRSLLTPVLERYQEVDRLLPQPTFRQFMHVVRSSLRRMPVNLFTAPFAVGRAIVGPISRTRRRARQRREITTALRFNYGTTASPRELASDRNYQRYFQRLDKEMYAKIVEKRLLQAMVGFLDEKGIDTHELIERQATLLNNGILVTGGGTINAQNVAAGEGAEAKTRVPRIRATTSGGGRA